MCYSVMESGQGLKLSEKRLTEPNLGGLIRFVRLQRLVFVANNRFYKEKRLDSCFKIGYNVVKLRRKEFYEYEHT